MPRLLVLLLAVAGCLDVRSSPSQPAPTAPSDVSQADELVLRIGTSAALPGGVSITFAAVSDDSRCPTGVTCVWEGDAVVQLRVEAKGDPAVDLQLHANPRFNQEGRAGALTLTLVRLEPFPQGDRPIPRDAYSATLQISSP